MIMKYERSIQLGSAGTPNRKAIRMVIYPKDIQLITGKSQRGAQFILQCIRVSLKKSKHQFITITEFCQFAGIEEQKVYEFLDPRTR
jgi:hypothetical protein